MDNEKKQVTYNSSFSGETQVTLDIQQYMNNKAMYIGLTKLSYTERYRSISPYANESKFEGKC